MILSRCSVPYVYSYDGRGQWVGNDSYRSYIRLAKGHEAKELKPYVNKMREDHFPLKEMKNMGIELNYDFTVLSDVYTQDPYVKKMGWIMGIIAFVLLFTSVMNYLLIIVGNLVGRSREMAVRKCYGAESKNIHAIIFSEALVHVGLSVVLAAGLVFLCKGTIENFLSAPVSTLVLNRGSWILVAICILVLLVGGLLPGWLYNRIPVAIAFRGYNENRNRWKLGLLGIQFVISGLLFSLLYIVNGQYQLMLGLNPGYDYDHVAIVSIDASNRDQRNQCLAEIRRMPNVKDCSSTFNVPLDGYDRSGNMVGVPGDEKNTFNIMEMSGGERTRLAILKLLLEPVNLLILDEPTNHLDLKTKDVLKQALLDFDGTLIVVSHDRDFLDGLVSKVYEFGHGRVREHLCGIYEFLESKKMENLQELEKKQ